MVRALWHALLLAIVIPTESALVDDEGSASALATPPAHTATAKQENIPLPPVSRAFDTAPNSYPCRMRVFRVPDEAAGTPESR
jgi:hypothetical protein